VLDYDFYLYLSRLPHEDLYIKNRRVVERRTEIDFTFTELVREGHIKRMDGQKKEPEILPLYY
jgi:hypothetical protein